jgi:hypothetical protein
MCHLSDHLYLLLSSSGENGLLHPLFFYHHGKNQLPSTLSSIWLLRSKANAVKSLGCPLGGGFSPFPLEIG